MNEQPLIPPGEPARSLRLSMIEGSIESCSQAITGGALVTGLALTLGANEFHLGLMSAIASVAVTGQLLAARMVSHLRRRKGLSISTAVVSRLMWAVVGVIPFFHISTEAKLWTFLGIMFASNFIGNMLGNTWLSWMTDLVTPEKRGRYFAVRNTICGLFAMASGYGASWLYDNMVANNLKKEAICLLFGLAAFWSMTAKVVMSKQWEPPMSGERPTPMWKLIRAPFLDKPYRKLLMFLIGWAAVTSVAAPFFGAHMISNLHMSFATIAVYSVVGGLITAIVQPLWGKIIDRVGCKPVLTVTLFCIGISPAFWLIARPGMFWPLWADAVIGSVFGPGFGLAIFNLVLTAAPRESRMGYIAVQSVVPAFVTVFASLGGGWIANAMHGLHYEIFGQTVVNFHVIFAMTLVGRLSLIPMIRDIHEEKARSVGVLLTLVRDKLQYTVVESIEDGVDIIKRLTR